MSSRPPRPGRPIAPSPGRAARRRPPRSRCTRTPGDGDRGRSDPPDRHRPPRSRPSPGARPS
ncbi:hypothetical protein DZF96_07905 [Clavibacter michiganensis]|uniref:Uncharacterized protein n=1 Tax=Clavibacter michiganensis TaxID=28447 RepID=A0A399NXF3_9MICO|nr:hypothetical protein DZF96_07905 [Clavibacter michiganensis]